MAAFTIGSRCYPSKEAAKQAVRDVLYRYSPGDKVDRPDDVELLRDLLDLHPDADEKVGPGVAGFRVVRGERAGVHAFEVVHTDDNVLDFGIRKCFDPPSLRRRVLEAMSHEIEPNSTAYLDSRVQGRSLVSDLSGTPVATNAVRVSHFQGPQRDVIATEFVEEHGGWDAIELTGSRRPGRPRFVDRELADEWRAYHRQRAVLGLLTVDEHLHRAYGS
ncbi:DCL family protein (plasmid) [Embleya sp. NBC_00888]|uniref:DCL family protein n=1 Tax=Embleya sp. NBC_00888 TaxID=2975960 RepID=UPI002F906E04|nr:DCL family protein [Embleya sp. NBC_00888]